MVKTLFIAAVVTLFCASTPLMAAAPQRKGQKPESTESAQDASKLPEHVKKCIEQHVPNCTVRQFDDQMDDGRHLFFVDVTTADNKNVTVLASGRAQYLGQLAEPHDDDDDSTDIDLATAPGPVKNAVEKHFKKTEIDSLSMEVEASRFIYVAEQTTNDITRWVTFSLQGELVSIEKEVPFKELPETVKQAISAAHPNAKPTSASEVNDQEKKTKEFVVDITEGKEKLEITATPEGKLVSTGPQDEESTTRP